MQFALQSMDKLQNAVGFGFDDRLYHHMAPGIPHRNHNRFLVHVHADILDVTTHLSCLLGGKLIRANVYLSPKVKSAILQDPSLSLLVADVNQRESGV